MCMLIGYTFLILNGKQKPLPFRSFLTKFIVVIVEGMESDGLSFFIRNVKDGEQMTTAIGCTHRT